MRRRLFLLAVAACLAYAVVAVAVWWQQDRLVFPGAGRPPRPVDVPEAEVFWLEGLGGLRFRAVCVQPTPAGAVLAFFVGNGEDLGSAARQARELASHGIAVVSAEYPGYGDSPGQPGVAALLQLAEVVARHAEERARRLGVPFVVGGSSLGSFCAVHVAAAGRARRCLLRAPPDSLAAVAAARFPWLPVRLLLRHRFDNAALAPAVRCPVCIVHGDRDEIVPLVHAERLRLRFGGPTTLEVVRGAGHNDLSLSAAGPVGPQVGAFLRDP
ncbi:MAG: alpha/beta hydrolase [Planctomycetes bacterium]|nr:alpha/beta hydrolase [Planctomycetota bacterium]